MQLRIENINAVALGASPKRVRQRGSVRKVVTGDELEKAAVRIADAQGVNELSRATRKKIALSEGRPARYVSAEWRRKRRAVARAASADPRSNNGAGVGTAASCMRSNATPSLYAVLAMLKETNGVSETIPKK